MAKILRPKFKTAADRTRENLEKMIDLCRETTALFKEAAELAPKKNCCKIIYPSITKLWDELIAKQEK